MSNWNDPTPEELEPAVEAFVAAVGPRRIHSDGTFVEGYVEAVVESLLAAGWKPPTTIQCNRCEHFIHEHDAGGCNACSCSLPHGGR